MKTEEILDLMQKNSSKKNQEGMERFAISGSKSFGVGLPFVRRLAGDIKKKAGKGADLNPLAVSLWKTGYHESKLLAGMVADVRIGWKQAEGWIEDCKNWAEVDQLCLNLLWKMQGVKEKALKFCEEEQEWVKRTGFVLMAVLAVREKEKMGDEFADACLLKIKKHSADSRNFIKKAVNWALRQIGKSTKGRYYGKALGLAEKLSKSENKAARWIGKDAKSELKAKASSLR